MLSSVVICYHLKEFESESLKYDFEYIFSFLKVTKLIIIRYWNVCTL